MGWCRTSSLRGTLLIGAFPNEIEPFILGRGITMTSK
jgi:hypothetical protein